MNQIDLAEFKPIPAHPAYLVHPDGRIASLKKERPRLLTVNNQAFRPSRWTVKFAGRRVRVSQLLFTVFGSSAAFDEAAWDEIHERPRRIAGLPGTVREDRNEDAADGPHSLAPDDPYVAEFCQDFEAGGMPPERTR